MSLPGNTSLKEHDPDMHKLIEQEKNRQWKSLELIASEVRLFLAGTRTRGLGRAEAVA